MIGFIEVISILGVVFFSFWLGIGLKKALATGKIVLEDQSYFERKKNPFFFWLTFATGAVCLLVFLFAIVAMLMGIF